MPNKLLSAMLLAACTLATACGAKDDQRDTASTADAADTGGAEDDGAITIPDPGSDYAPSRWYDDGGYHGTPETAQAMGIILDVPSYFQGVIDPET